METPSDGPGKKRFSMLIAVLAGILMATSGGYAGAACTPTGFYKDSMNLTAAVIDPSGTYSDTLDATGCNIGVYYGPGASGAVDGANISGANYYGVLVAGDCGNDAPSCTPGATSVDVKNSSINDINDHPLSGDQHGAGIAYYAFAAGASATGTVSGSTVSDYQKSGIIALGPGASVSISNNIVTGIGPTGEIAQNGIEIDYGASGQVTRNVVTGNSYTGTGYAASGILVFGGCGTSLTTGVQVVKNVVGSTTPADGNDIGVALDNLDSTCTMAPSTGASGTNNKAINNTITNDERTNGIPYQVGVADCGVNDKLIANEISGSGYGGSFDTSSDTGYTTIDTDSCTIAAKVQANK